MTTPEILTTRDGQPIVPGMAVVVCHVPEHDFYAGLIYEATVTEIASNGITLASHRGSIDGCRTGARSLFSSHAALDSWVETNEALADIDAQMLRNAR